MEEKYKPEAYWEKRFAEKVDLTTVGQMGLGYIYNSWLYKARFRAVRRALRKLRIRISGKTLIDVGAGSGAWIPFWERCGVSRIVGLDITSASVSALQKKYPQFKFFQGDICSALPFHQEEKFDIVTVFDVLFHIVDDEDFHNAVSNLSRLVKEGGLVLISDGFGKNSYGPIYHEYHRTFQQYMNELNRIRLQPIHFEPIFFVMTTPICASDSKSGQFLSKSIGIMLRIIALAASHQQFAKMNHWAGFTLYLLDTILYRMMESGPSLKVLFARKR
jgi:ubiquinone/menaquinone biosynthesis C-methylase UbiE